MRAVTVTEVSQVGEARRFASDLAALHGFDEQDAGRVALVATELATNLIKHGGGGELLISWFDDRTGCGIECIALDKGSGMDNVDAAMRDGYSTAGTAGTGLGAVIR
ncbi:MAG: putative anti-sigma regulatory factor, partial [Sphingomonadales bacterium]|nr:putative anti-sigma regulatory factor [Sphingomonadales bacterium]